MCTYTHFIGTWRTTRLWSVISGSRSIAIKWVNSLHNPTHVRYHTLCRTVGENKPYLDDTKVAKSSLNAIIAENLKEWSYCDFVIKVLFNPAAFDDGKHISTTTSRSLYRISTTICLFHCVKSTEQRNRTFFFTRNSLAPTLS